MRYMITVTNDGTDGLLLTKVVEDGDLRDELDEVFKLYDFQMVRVWQECGMDFYPDNGRTTISAPGRGVAKTCPGGDHPFVAHDVDGHCSECGYRQNG